jgi:hypothetical protein
LEAVEKIADRDPSRSLNKTNQNSSRSKQFLLDYDVHQSNTNLEEKLDVMTEKYSKLEHNYNDLKSQIIQKEFEIKELKLEAN